MTSSVADILKQESRSKVDTSLSIIAERNIIPQPKNEQVTVQETLFKRSNFHCIPFLQVILFKN